MKKIKYLMLTMIMMFSMTANAFAVTEAGANSDKKELYQHYVAAVQEASTKYDARIELKPFETFDFSTAAPIDDFKATLKALGEVKMQNTPTALNKSNALTMNEYEQQVKERMNQPRSAQTVTHYDNVSVGTNNVRIRITGRFETYYNSVQGRQLFSSNSYIRDISSATSGYTWNTSFLDERMIDGGRTYYVVAQGSVEYSNMTWYDLEVSTEFYCSATGGVS